MRAGAGQGQGQGQGRPRVCVRVRAGRAGRQGGAERAACARGGRGRARDARDPRGSGRLLPLLPPARLPGGIGPALGLDPWNGKQPCTGHGTDVGSHQKRQNEAERRPERYARVSLWNMVIYLPRTQEKRSKVLKLVESRTATKT